MWKVSLGFKRSFGESTSPELQGKLATFLSLPTILLSSIADCE